MVEPFHEIFYCSTLAPHESPATVSAILAQARNGNARSGITGLLIFDGLHFLQHLEGPPPQVQQLATRIFADPRHTQLHVIYQGPLAMRRCRGFEMGYAEPSEDDEAYERLAREGQAGLLRFLAQRPSYDIRN
jgi:hypothetical protein